MTLQKRKLGKTGEMVTVLGYGAMELRGRPVGPEVDDEAAGRILNQVLDSGINLIDTSIDYGNSESLIGRFISHRRVEYFLASKCGCAVGDTGVPTDRPPHDYTRTNVRSGVENSLRRMKTDHLDLVELHLSPSRQVLEANDTVAELQALKAQGKTRFIGISGTLPDLPDQIAMGVFDVFQIPYSAVQREHEELISAATKAGAGTLIRGGAARGQASAEKKWQRGPIGLQEGEGRRRWEASRIEEILGAMSPMEFVLRFTISHPDVTSTIVGTSSVEHLKGNVAIAEKGPLPSDLYEEAKRRFTTGSGGYKSAIASAPSDSVR